jgi:hypothetical protein
MLERNSPPARFIHIFRFVSADATAKRLRTEDSSREVEEDFGISA